MAKEKTTTGISGIKIRVKKPRATAKSVDEKYTGSEPSFDGVKFKNETARKLEVIRSLNWYNYHISNKEKTAYVIDHMKSAKFSTDDMAKIKSVNPMFIPNALVAFVRMEKHGFVSSIDERTYVSEVIASMISKAKVVEAIEKPKGTYKPNPQLFIREKVNKLVIGELEELFDGWETAGFSNINIVEMIKANDIKSASFKYITDYINGILSEYESTDEQMVEAYSHIKSRELNKRIMFFKEAISDIETFSASTKATKVRVVRKKAVNVQSLVKSFKYKTKDNEFNIVSASPDNVIGAFGVMLFNTKYKVFTLLQASGPAGLSIKGSTITGIDEATSIRKSSRKPKDDIKDLLKKSITVSYKALSALQTKPQDINGRVNEHVVILRIFK